MLRFFYICGILLKYAFLYVLIRFNISHTPLNKLIKKIFEDAGGSFIKFGQLLSLRVDILPKEYSIDMFDLLDNVKAFSYDDVKEVFISDLGATPEKIFIDFQKEPFASGSFGQVHAAKLDDQTIVAVKILRPGIEETVQADFLVITFLAYIGDLFFKISGFSWREFAEEFKRWTIQELDYHIEAEHAQRMIHNLEPDDHLVIPKIYDRYSTKRILVQEYIEGVHLSRVFRGLKDGRLTHDEMKKMGYDLKALSSLLSQELLKQYFIHGFFHADLHPGNIILLPNNKIALIDFGIVGESLASNQEEFMHFIKAAGDFKFKEATFYFATIAGKDLRRMIMSAFPASIDQEQVNDFLRVLTDHFSQVVERIFQENRTALNTKKTDYTVMLMKILAASENYKIKLPREFAIFIKTLSTLGLLCKEMDYDYRVNKEIKLFFERNPIETMPLPPARNTTYRRISRERAFEQLNNWLAYLIEVDPAIYKLVNTYITQYNLVDK